MAVTRKLKSLWTQYLVIIQFLAIKQQFDNPREQRKVTLISNKSREDH